ncbi:hypothetical protein BpHYR1_008870 [Brachionus plicatilis]|uniref:Uncharacterized protein n=1 Tax=Brachionus plicatilis TaxID=10195 RepID=A0A3M7Q1L4_BRAPC|nr:hypothetical protein BpHYR1_008870 [Brachionus plicatilis]
MINSYFSLLIWGKIDSVKRRTRLEHVNRIEQSKISINYLFFNLICVGIRIPNRPIFLAIFDRFIVSHVLIKYFFALKPRVYVSPCTKYPFHGIKACVAKQGDTLIVIDGNLKFMIKT